jgi:hypothetical protein
MPLRTTLAALSLAAVAATAAGGAPAPRKITEITLERTPCFGTCPVDKLTVRADGTAAYEGTRFVKRLGRYAGRFKGYEKLVRVAGPGAFLALKDRYAAAATDLPTHTLTLIQSGKAKRVSDYGAVAPPPFQSLEGELLALAAKIPWKKAGPEPSTRRSGIRGTAVVGPISPVERPGQENTRPLPGAMLRITGDARGGEAQETTADANGRFEVALRPGVYRILPLPPDPTAQLPRATPLTVKVRPGRFETLRIVYDSGIR